MFTPAVNVTGTNYANFHFHVQDNGSTANGGVNIDPTARVMTISVVVSQAHAPVGTSKTVTTAENTAYKFSVADFGFSDPNDNPANTLSAVEISSLPAAGTLVDNGQAVTQGQLVSVADITAGKLVFTPAVNAVGLSYSNFHFHVEDNGSTANGGINVDPTARVMTINVVAS